jgi:ribosomal protein L37E
MQFKGKRSRNWKKLKLHAKSKRCHICCYPMKKTAVYIWDIKSKDTKELKCINCLTMYDTEFEITNIGIVREVGYS